MTIPTQIIDPSLKSRIRKDDDLMLVLAKANSVRVGTVDRWLRDDDQILTTATNLEVIRTHFKLGARVKLTQPSITNQQDKAKAEI